MKKYILSAALLIGLGAAASPAAAECMRGPFSVDMAADRLDVRVQEIAHKTGCAMSVDPDLLRGKRAPRLRGSYTTAQMLNLTLMNSGLASTWDTDHWTIVRHGGDAARVSPRQEHEQAITDLRNRFARTDARIETARRSRAITPARASALHRQVAKTRASMAALTRRQGFVSRAELVTYQNTLGTIDIELDRRGVNRSYGDDGIPTTRTN